MKKHIQTQQADKLYLKTLLDNFGNILVYIFTSKQNQALLGEFQNSIQVFGQYENVKYYCWNIQDCPNTFTKYGVESTPYIIITNTFKDILYKDDHIDYTVFFDKLHQIRQAHLINFSKQAKIWEQKINYILKSCPIIAFIKGTPQQPKCGFTSTLLQILKEHQIEYTYYDIVQDPKMRSWLRYFKKWPTYPQLFVKGQLIGGLDVIKEAITNGSLMKKIPKSSIKQSIPEQYNQFVTQNDNIIFTNGFVFQDKSIGELVEKIEQRIGKCVLYNVNLNKDLKEYITNNVHNKFPVAINKGKLIE